MTLTLTSELVFIIIVSGHISYIILGRNTKFGGWMHIGMAEYRVPPLGHCDIDLDL